MAPKGAAAASGLIAMRRQRPMEDSMRRSHHTQSSVGSGLSRRSLLQLAGAGAALPVVGSALSGCGSGSGGADSGKLTFVYRGDATQQDAFNKLFEELNKKQPELKLEPQGIPADDVG